MDSLINDDHFSIVGIKGKSPLELQAAAADPEFIVDLRKYNYFTPIEVQYAADPYLIIKNGIEILFFELLLKSGKGVIARLDRQEGTQEWCNPRIVVEESFHLSYPLLYDESDGTYMLVESAENSDVRLYKSTDDKLISWDFENTILSGKYYDPTIFKHDDKWYMFASSTADFSKLDLFYSDAGINGRWILHPSSPLHADSSSSRGAGPILEWNSETYRLAQDCSLRYGQSVKAFKILHIDRESYSEEAAGVILTGTGTGWNEQGMHHLRVYRQSDNTILAVSDGYRKV